MLFDLRGRRRRAVQATYLGLAVLMGGGLVFFGIGGSVSGGLLDAFKGGGGGGGGGNSALEKRVERNEERLQASPRNTAVLKALVRDEYQLATAQTTSSSTTFPKSARDELAKAGAYWRRYLAAEKGTPDPSLAAVALQVFDVGALNRPRDAQRAAEIIAAAQNTPQAYIRVVQYATLAGDARTADLAGKKAVELAPKGQEAAVKGALKQAKQTRASPPPQG